ncbi:MAG: ImmA/IrrE family metallo-endopeptidase [Euzebya sp.]
MSVRWERLAGDTARFAVRVSFLSDPHDGQGADPDLAASWGGLQLWVDGVNLSAHIDGGQMLDAAYWYQLPFLEWLASNWDALLHEQRLPNPDSDDAASVRRPWLDLVDSDGMTFHQLQEDWDWRSRHSLRFARDGGVMPGVFLRRHRGVIEVSWQDRPVSGAEDVRHAAPNGRGYLDPEFVASSLYDVLREASAYILALRPESERIRQLSSKVEKLTEPASDVRTAWLAGLGSSKADALSRWQSLRDLVEQRVEGAVDTIFNPTQNGSPLVLTGSPTAALLFSSLSPSIDDDDVIALTTLAIERPLVTVDPMAGHSRGVPLATSAPAWEQGYELAEEARDLFEIDDGMVVNVEDLLASNGVQIAELELHDSGIRAITLTGQGRQQRIAVNLNYPHANTPEVRRFTLAHELCHLLFDEDYGVPVAIASGPWAPDGLEQRANAFAAMFLMPPPLLRNAESRAGLHLEDGNGLGAVAREIGVSRRALLEHARNVGLVRTEAYSRLSKELTTARDQAS